MEKSEIIVKRLRLEKKDIAYVKFIIEGYEGIALVTTINNDEAVIELTIAPDFESDVEGLLAALKEEINFQEIKE
ncbi:MAG: DUF4911 domain-containing protein [Syntrophobacterales bacterium]|nr:MAG: DUF4911 domain-containing protein [Syntrophobacterales bacterium]